MNPQRSQLSSQQSGRLQRMLKPPQFILLPLASALLSTVHCLSHMQQASKLHSPICSHLFSTHSAASLFSTCSAPGRLSAQSSALRLSPAGLQLSTNQNKQIVFSKPAEELSAASFALPSDRGINFLQKTIDSLNGLVLVHFCRKARF